MRLFGFFRRKKSAVGNIGASDSEAREADIPKFEEVFTIESRLFIHEPADSTIDSHFTDDQLNSAIVTLGAGLRAYLSKISDEIYPEARNPTNQHKSMVALADTLLAEGAVPIAFTQWSQSPIQGIAARMVINDGTRTALFGPSLAMVRNTAPFHPEISAIVESAHQRGEVVYILAIDGLAYGVFTLSHAIRQVQ
jgi:hypothetical protein